MLTHFSLFTGIGGMDIAAEWAGFRTVGQCEYADYPTKVLEKHWPDVPRWKDIRDVTAENFCERTGLRTVDIISGGFPCQPFSVAGKQKGKEDDRYLWPEMLRVIRELTPYWVIGENVPGILRIAGRTVCEDLEREGYAVAVFDYEAAAVGAPHRRERVFFVANRNGNNSDAWRTEPAGQQRQAGIANGSHDVAYSSIEGNRRISIQPRGSHQTNIDTYGRRENVADTDSNRQYKQTSGNTSHDEKRNDSAYQQVGWSGYGTVDGSSWWNIEPNVGRVANGVPARVDRLKCLGNAVVPQQVCPIFQAIHNIEMGLI